VSGKARKTVGGNENPKCVQEGRHHALGGERASRELRGDGEMVVEVAVGVRKSGLGWLFSSRRGRGSFRWRVDSPGEIETVLNERSAGESVIADAIAANPGIDERQREKKKKKEQRSALRERRKAMG